MAFWRTIPLQRQVEWAASVLRFANSGSVALPPHLTLPARRASLRQWTVVGVVSIVLGFFAIGAALLPSRWLPLALYVAFTALSLIVAHDVQLSFYFIFMLVQTFFLFVYIVGTVRTQQDVLFIVTVLMVGLLLEGMIMVGSEFLGHGAGIVQW